jgi:hypothetical protein
MGEIDTCWKNQLMADIQENKKILGAFRDYGQAPHESSFFSPLLVD